MSYYSIDTAQLTAAQVARLHEFVQKLRGEGVPLDSPAALPATAPSSAATGWTINALARLIALLRERGNAVHERLLYDSDGTLQRADILSEEGRDADAPLTRWSLPYSTVTAQLQQEGIISADAAPVVTPVRNANQLQGYQVNAEIIGLLARWIRITVPGRSVKVGDVLDSGESVTSPMLAEQDQFHGDHAVSVYRLLGPRDRVDRQWSSSHASFDFWRSVRADFGEFVEAIVVRPRDRVPGLILTDANDATLYLNELSAGYEGVGPTTAVEILTAEGFSDAKRVVFDRHRLDVPAHIYRPDSVEGIQAFLAECES